MVSNTPAAIQRYACCYAVYHGGKSLGSIRLRPWAIHDGIFGEPFTNVTMYKRVGVSANISTTPGCEW